MESPYYGPAPDVLLPRSFLQAVIHLKQRINAIYQPLDRTLVTVRADATLAPWHQAIPQLFSAAIGCNERHLAYLVEHVPIYVPEGGSGVYTRVRLGSGDVAQVVRHIIWEWIMDKRDELRVAVVVLRHGAPAGEEERRLTATLNSWYDVADATLEKRRIHPLRILWHGPRQAPTLEYDPQELEGMRLPSSLAVLHTKPHQKVPPLIALPATGGVQYVLPPVLVHDSIRQNIIQHVRNKAPAYANALALRNETFSRMMSKELHVLDQMLQRFIQCISEYPDRQVDVYAGVYLPTTQRGVYRRAIAVHARLTNVTQMFAAWTATNGASVGEPELLLDLAYNDDPATRLSHTSVYLPHPVPVTSNCWFVQAGNWGEQSYPEQFWYNTAPLL